MNAYGVAAIVTAVNIPATISALYARKVSRRIGLPKSLEHRPHPHRRAEDHLDTVPLNTAIAILHSEVLDLQQNFTDRMDAQDRKIDAMERRIGK